MTDSQMIYAYTDEQAIADGVLKEYHVGDVDRVTATLWNAYMRFDDDGALIDDDMRKICMDIQKQEPQDDIRILLLEGVTIWCMPNERGMLTVMLPSDY